MPMFDDPKKALKNLERQLLAEEEDAFTEEIYEVYTEEEFFDEEDWLEQEIAEAKALSGYQEPQVRNYANGYGGAGAQRPSRPRQQAQPGFDPQRRSYMSGYSGYAQQERPAYRPNVGSRYEEEPEEEQEESVRGLVALAIALTLGIVAVAAYWVLVLL